MAYGQNIPTAVRYLLGFIAERESAGNYRVVYAHHQNVLPKPITEMPISELLVWQKKLGSRYGSSAAGAYQHIRTTLLAQVTRLKIPMSEKFTPGLQDDLGWDLLRQRGLDDFLGGKKSLAAFGNSLAMEWASLPVLVTVTSGKKKRVRGRSWYDGDGLNAAGHKAETFERALKETLRLHALRKPVEKQADWPLDAPPLPDDPGVEPTNTADEQKSVRLGRWIALGLVLAISAAILKGIGAW